MRSGRARGPRSIYGDAPHRLPTDMSDTERSSLLASDETIAGARAGDRDALGELWRTYQPQLLRLLRSGRCPSPDDVASQTWIDVGRGLENFVGDGVGFRRWLFTIARRRQIDAGRRDARRRDRPVADPEHFADERAGTVADVADAGDAALERALALLAKLPERQAQAVLLRSVYDMDVADVAAILDVSHENVRVLVHRGLATLRRRTEPPGHDVTTNTQEAVTGGGDRAF